MTVFEKIKNMDIDEFAKWFDDNCAHDEDPAIRWWNEKYCNVCESEIDGFNEFCWCELHGKCIFFQDMDEVPNRKDMVKLWLESKW